MLDEGLMIMLRIIPFAVLMMIAVPSFATEVPSGNVIAQEKQAPPQTQVPKRDCEKKKDEGVSA